MDKLKKKEEWEIPKEFLKTKHVEYLVKQWVINVLNYHTCPNCWDDYLEDEWCLDCGYWVLNNSWTFPEIKKAKRSDFFRPSTSVCSEKEKNIEEKKIKEIEIEHNWELVRLNDYKRSKNGVEYIIFEKHGEKYKIFISEVRIIEGKLDFFKFRIEKKRWNKYKYDYVTKDDFWKIKNITNKFLKKLLLKQ